MGKQIEYEALTLRLPKAVLEYVRRMYGDPVKWLEYFVVDWLRIDVEEKDGDELKELFGLEPAFQVVLDQS
jgi:hypothetical protein